MVVLTPDTEAQVVEAIRDASGSLAIEGHATKQGLGRPVTSDAVLRLAGLTGLTMYEPDEMVFAARPGTPLKEIAEALAVNGQCLAFEPGDWGPLWDRNEGATIGGTIAAGIAGPRRFAAGAPRDHLLGFVAVNGKGERFKAGGRVVKNVTGYDLPKLAAGSFGTLFAMTELTMRAVPRGAATCTMAWEDKEAIEALRALRAAAASPLAPSGLAHFPPAVALRVTGSNRSLTLVRVEGEADAAAARAAELARTIVSGARVVEQETAAELFRALADVHPLFDAGVSLWRISLPPTRAHEFIVRMAPDAWAADAAGGILWFAFANPDAASIHEAALAYGGHAMLVRRAGVAIADVFPPLAPPMLALTQRLKHAFDPAQRLNPGRMYEGV